MMFAMASDLGPLRWGRSKRPVSKSVKHLHHSFGEISRMATAAKKSPAKKRKAPARPAAPAEEPMMAEPVREAEPEAAPAPSWATPEPTAPSWGNGGDHN